MKKKILVIDDDPIIVKYLVSLFNDNGYKTCTACDGLQAAEVFKQEKPNLITLDLQMPEEWGPRFYRKLIKNKEFRAIPVVVISGLDGGHAIRNAVAFIQKPFDPDELLNIIKNNL